MPEIDPASAEPFTGELDRIGHDLRTPLNHVLGFAQLLLLDEGSLSPQQRAYVAAIEAGGERLLALIGAALDDAAERRILDGFAGS